MHHPKLTCGLLFKLFYCSFRDRELIDETGVAQR